MTLQAKNAVVTGSTSGIGLAIARAFAKEGANVMINGLGDAATDDLIPAGQDRGLLQQPLGIRIDEGHHRQPTRCDSKYRLNRGCRSKVDLRGFGSHGVHFPLPIIG